MDIIGYGEDALTFWVLNSQIQQLFTALKDSSNPENSFIFYRPSYGRGGGDSCFGEFDSIIGTKQAIYLIETKWHADAQSTDKEINLSPAQVDRHTIMKWYIENWKQIKPANWNNFVKQSNTSFQQRFPSKSQPACNTLLARNIEFIMSKLNACPLKVINVLMYCGIAGENRNITLGSSICNFRLIKIYYTPQQNGSFYFAMN